MPRPSSAAGVACIIRRDTKAAVQSTSSAPVPVQLTPKQAGMTVPDLSGSSAPGSSHHKGARPAGRVRIRLVHFGSPKDVRLCDSEQKVVRMRPQTAVPTKSSKLSSSEVGPELQELSAHGNIVFLALPWGLLEAEYEPGLRGSDGRVANAGRD